LLVLPALPTLVDKWYAHGPLLATAAQLRYYLPWSLLLLCGDTCCLAQMLGAQ
ncbi:hypothetical protein U1Q18_008251, partial [Sarracenia purpurea var. burkii]